MELQYAVIADYVSVTETGNINLLGIFDHIGAYAYPARHASLTVAFRMRFSSSEASGPPLKVAIKLLDIDGNTLVEMRADTTLQRPAGLWGWWDQRLTLNNLLFEKEGEYTFSLLVNGMEKATIPLRMSVHPRSSSAGDGTSIVPGE